MSAFQFKQFKVEQENSGMKVNTDGVLLGAWMTIQPTDRTLLDVGTGSGVIALMAAQRMAGLQQYLQRDAAELQKKDIVITAIDIDKGSCEDAAKNFANSPWSANLKVLHCPFQELTQGKYDIIFSNPPYFINSLKSPDSIRSNTRHTDTLSQSELIRCAMLLLAPGGRLALVLPAAESELLLEKVAFIRKHTKNGEHVLHLSRLCKVRTTESKPAKRYLMEFVLDSAESKVQSHESELVMQKGPVYTEIYKTLTQDFYLNF